MDLTVNTESFLKSVTETLINSITSEIRERVVKDVTAHVLEFDLAAEIRRQIDTAIRQAIENYPYQASRPGMAPFPNNPVTNTVFDTFAGHMQDFITRLIDRVENSVFTDMNTKLNTLNIHTLIVETASSIIKNQLETANYRFPDASIPGRAINPNGIEIHRENLLPGIIRNFESTGIQDLANDIKLTITDNHVVVENHLCVNEITVAKDLRINGSVNDEFKDYLVNLVIQAFRQQYQDGTYDQYCDRVISRLEQNGISAETIKAFGESLVDQSRINSQITESNLQRLGVLKELQVIGETLLDDTFYVSKSRIGINTLEPERTLDLWDQEVQIVAGKKLKDVAMFGTIRNQNLILSANNRDNLILNADGTVTVKEINLGNINHSSGQERPSYNRPMGFVVWNEKPSIGSVVGWVSLGGARWAGFGTITE